jgi:Transposase DDE domain
MSQQRALYQWTTTVAHHLPVLRRSQAKVLAAFSLGVALARRCTLSVVAEALPGLGKPDTVERRLQRFLSNPRLAWEAAAEALAVWILGSVPRAGVVVLLVDETSLQEHLKVMVVSLAYRGRAIPLAWWCYAPRAYPMGQVALIATLFQRLATALPADCRVLVQADRGIGTSPDLLRAIHQRGWYYLVRVQGQVRLRLDDGRTVRFAMLVPRPGRRWAGWAYAFKKAGWCRCWVVGQWRRPHQEPWLLVTNWPGAQGSWYGLRMWEEVAFRDLKSMGWQWQRSRVWTPEHAKRLWLVMALAYAWTLSLGTRVIRTPALRQELTRGKDWRRSVFQLGLRLLTRWLTLGRRLFYELWLIPHLPTLPKSVVQ